jgi:hypothetical protein
MRYLFGFLCVCALGVMPLVGCDDAEGAGGSGGIGGDGGTGGSNSAVFPCTEQGIVDAIAEGGGPHTFSCVGPQTVTTDAEIVIDNNVILDGEGNLTVDGNDDRMVFSVPEGVTAELHGFALTGNGSAISVVGATFTLANCSVFDNAGLGVFNNSGAVTVLGSTVSGNRINVWNDGGTMAVENSTISGGKDAGGEVASGGIQGGEHLTMVNSTVSGNAGVGVSVGSTTALTNCTISDNEVAAIGIGQDSAVTLAGTIIDGGCNMGGAATSDGYNIESPGNTCGFDQTGDQSDITEMQLNLGDLADNGGPTMTHEPGAGSAAIDHIPGGACDLTEDQRGEPRPEPGGTMCDVGSVEVQPSEL